MRRLLPTIDNRRSTIAAQRPAFTLVELLVVIGIIALLAGILFPTIAKVRIAGQEADSRSLLNQIDSACQAYFTDFKAYPGPLSYALLNATNQTDPTLGGTPIYPSMSGGTAIDDNVVSYGTGGASSATAAVFGASGTRITGAENLLLGLCGGLALDRPNNRYYFDAAAVGQGPVGFNALRPNRATAYLQPTSLSSISQAQNAMRGRIQDEAGTPTGVDSIIPEFVDRFAVPMPFLYMRSRNQGVYDAADPEELVINSGKAINDYNIIEIQPYTGYRTGAGSTLKPSDYKIVSFNFNTPHGLRTADRSLTIHKDNKIPGLNFPAYPYDAYDYLIDPASYDRTQTSAPTAAQFAAKRVRKKDSYVLISAGRDRIYGTADDIANFGSVLP